MLYRTVPKTGDRLSILGFGYMRLPSGKGGTGIDEERAIRQLRSAIDRGVNYVDTAPAYHLGKSERILGRALEDGYRDRVRIATKLPPWSVRCREDMDRILDGQLAALKTDHIDYYLLHSLQPESFLRLKNLGVLEFLDTAKKDGRIVNAGFSTHTTLPAFREIVDAYDWTFCQIQYNYLDEQNQAGTEGLRYAHEKNLAVMVMEPLRGGNLGGRVPDEIQAIWDGAGVKRSPAAWGLRWVWNHPEVTVVLSGMNDEAHIDENLKTADEGYPGSLTPGELSRIGQVREVYRRLMKVGCTGCSYCMPCPAGVDIPGCFSLYNDHYLFPHNRMAKFQYFGRHGGLMGGISYAGLCRRCGKCEKACPQHLPVRALLSDVSRELEPGMRFVIPVLKGGLWCMDQAATIRRFISPRR
ncbi:MULTISPECIES: aldo/keto reductase [unclassified Methanoregula]|uniref:aldo/keto reductase n=1 Tax=unclassified Methanoregula TaxID=2649730 RepID=UPI0009CE2F8E|nr:MULTISPECIES: aldo/keto reductase [unclassified Methanoregula]OPX62821.1 MAG: putative oxidoreductase [Methanoregula sp. PtaB.Bin085]OPY35258.1 MAG: putative oxidoreductase [Methanoregula sp. PtaU1.Bin006]